MTQATFIARLNEGLTEEESLVWDVVQSYRGKDQAVTNELLARLAGVPERRLRSAIKALVEQHRKPIGSLPGLGVFLVETREEREEVMAFYRSHALSLLHRMCILGQYSTRHMLGQIEIDLRKLEDQQLLVGPS